METIIDNEAVETQVTIRLNKADYDRALSTGQDFGKVVNYLIEQHSKGGVMLKHTQARYLETLTDNSVRTGDDIMRAVESGMKRHSANGALRLTYDLDPAFAVPFEEYARAASRNPEEILQDMMAVLFTSSWYLDLKVPGGTAYFSEEDRQELEKTMGAKQLTGRDIVDWCRDNRPQPKQVVTAEEHKRMSKVKTKVLELMNQPVEA